MPEIPKKHISIQLTEDEIELWKSQSKKNSCTLSRYVRDLVKKDAEDYREDVVDAEDYRKLQEGYKKVVAENESLKNDVILRLEDFIRKEWKVISEKKMWDSLSRKEKIARKQRRYRLDEKVKTMTDDYFESSDYQKRVGQTVIDAQEGFVLEKQWDSLTPEQQEKATELMYEKNLALPDAIKRIKGLNLLPEFKVIFG